MDVKTRLTKEFNEQMDTLNVTYIGDVELADYEAIIRGTTQLADRLIDIEKIEAEKEIEERKLQEEKKNQLIRNAIEIGKIIVPVIAAFSMGLISMKWEKTDTLTSTAGKGALRDILRFK